MTFFFLDMEKLRHFMLRMKIQMKNTGPISKLLLENRNFPDFENRQELRDSQFFVFQSGFLYLKLKIYITGNI
ncbi:hypothetical protein SDC9_139416 [bioreactor metagenome]|uniref:Uncharacterized protein n=1 Tax=bioreactor metagenome TaxID=1076179 RepID=A0A645DSJ0_9ZZZZ